MFKNFGPAFPRKCVKCNNEEFWHLCRLSVWVTFFFIPILPYKYDRLLVCPICESSIILDGNQFEEIKPVAELNLQLAEKKITEDQHRLKMSEINNKTQLPEK